MNNTLEMIRRFSDAKGPSGFEDEVVNLAREYAEELGTLEEDCLRNLYIYRKENTGTRPVIMLDAHSDEVGFMVHSIKPNGTLRFVPLGGWSKNSLVSSKVLVRNAQGEYIPGIIASKPVHFMSAAERANPTLEISDMVIDIGAVSDTEAVEKFHIRIGEPVVPATKLEFDDNNDILFGKAFDCRIGCAALIEVLKRLEGKELPCDVVGVLSSQEEVGDRGCKVAVNRVQPAAAIVLEGCPADDTFTESYAVQTALKKGPMFRFMDTSTICNPRFQRYVLDLAEEKNIPVQASVREGGGNNAAVINTALLGAPAVVAGVPVRYIHSMNCMTSMFDFEATVNMVCALLENLTPEQISKF
ncbi:MAG: M42 family metallopeptidase [Oscillospiraceae bacterium]|nr:M42 family metallopeptidase [Oscillospiraceae bacterium]